MKGSAITGPIAKECVRMLQDEINAAILNTMLQNEINAAILNTTAIMAQPIFGVGDGSLLDIEDYVAIEENHSSKGKFDPFVNINGKNVSKPCAL